MGLRETKKEKVRSAIIENAIALFRERGFEATRVREIAEAAEVSEATFFNYFPTKDAVLSAWALGAVRSAFAAAAGNPDRGIRPLLRHLCADLAERTERDAAFAAKAWSHARLAGASSLPEVTALLEASQQSGQLRRDLSARQLGEILYVAICGSIASWLERQGPPGSLASELRRAADLVLDGARRRNERVRPAARTAAGAAFSTR